MKAGTQLFTVLYLHENESHSVAFGWMQERGAGLLFKWVTALKALYKGHPVAGESAAGRGVHRFWMAPPSGGGIREGKTEAGQPRRREKAQDGGIALWQGRTLPQDGFLPGLQEDLPADVSGVDAAHPGPGRASPSGDQGDRKGREEEWEEGEGAARARTSSGRSRRRRVGPGRQPGLTQHQRPLPLPLDARPHRGRQLPRLLRSRRLRRNTLHCRHLHSVRRIAARPRPCAPRTEECPPPAGRDASTAFIFSASGKSAPARFRGRGGRTGGGRGLSMRGSRT